jgi:ABC-type microcin C transport system permease subunit YejE
MINMDKSMLFNLRSCVSSLAAGILFGAIVGCFSTYRHLESKYVELHHVNVGYFVFKEGKLYSLLEIKTAQ